MQPATKRWHDFRTGGPVKHFIMHLVVVYGYPGIFGALVVGIFGAPIPDEILLSFAGYLSSKGEMNLHLAILTAFLGSCCGITLSYGVGRSFGFYLVDKYGRFLRLSPEKLGKSRDWIGRYGRWALTAGYFIPGIRHLVACLAGVSRMSFTTFSLFAFTGALIWTSVYIIFGYYMGKDWIRISEKLHSHLLASSIIVSVMVVGWFFLRRVWRNDRTKLKTWWF